MLYDIRTRPDQLKAAADWTQDGPDAADVELLADDSMLLVEQGDDRNAFDQDGSPGSEEYLQVAPLDRTAAGGGSRRTAGDAVDRAIAAGDPALARALLELRERVGSDTGDIIPDAGLTEKEASSLMIVGYATLLSNNPPPPDLAEGLRDGAQKVGIALREASAAKKVPDPDRAADAIGETLDRPDPR